MDFVAQRAEGVISLTVLLLEVKVFPFGSTVFVVHQLFKLGSELLLFLVDEVGYLVSGPEFFLNALLSL